MSDICSKNSLPSKEGDYMKRSTIIFTLVFMASILSSYILGLIVGNLIFC